MSITQDEFALPTSLDEAEERRAQLTLDVQSIQAQLGDKQRTDENGKRLTSKEYWAWKKRAQHALNQRLNELRAVKQWIRDKKRGLSVPALEIDAGASLEEAVGHVHQLALILSKLDDEEVEFSKEERIQIDAAGHFLRRVVAKQPQQNQG
jgi:hypothetical protein